ncbi:methionyl-tRNA synthetase [Balamuthia mandrillaris]
MNGPLWWRTARSSCCGMSGGGRMLHRGGNMWWKGASFKMTQRSTPFLSSASLLAGRSTTMPLSTTATSRSDAAAPEQPTLSSSTLSRYSATDKPIMITTPIFYVNGSPHIGHLYSALLADALARWFRMLGARTLFVTGTDEHGYKVQTAAEQRGKTPQEFCQEVSQEFKDLFDSANISYDRFVRTTEELHRRAVERLWCRLRRKGDLYLGSYQGWYCVSDEAFLAGSQVMDASDTGQKVSVESGRPVEWVTEENYKFRLSAFQQRLKRCYGLLQEEEEGNNNERKRQEIIRVEPSARFNELKAMLMGVPDEEGKGEGTGLPDLSVSRKAGKVTWAIPVPDDSDHTIYVWLDALTNYLTASGYASEWQEPEIAEQNGEKESKAYRGGAWPADYHIIGKDILRFHTIYWPAFLLSAGLALPKRIIAHSHWTVSKKKMSKSLGNVIDPRLIINDYGLDNFRYFLLREGGMENDGDFSYGLLVARVNADLCDNLGNLVSRLVTPTVNPGQAVPPRVTLAELQKEEDKLLAEKVARLPGIVDEHYRNLNFGPALQEILGVLTLANKYFHDQQPWQLRKEQNQARLDTVMYITMEAARIPALLLQPVVPGYADRILDMLGVGKHERDASFLEFGSGRSGAATKKQSLFKKLNLK